MTGMPSPNRKPGPTRMFRFRSVRSLVLCLCFLLMARPAQPATDSSADPMALAAYALVPGLGHWQLGLPVEGCVIFGAWLGTRALGERLMPPVFYPGLPDHRMSLFSLISASIYRLQLFDSYQEARIRHGESGYPVPLDRITPLELIMAPFLPAQWTDGGVWVLPAIALMSQAVRLSDRPAGTLDALAARRVTSGKTVMSAQEAFVLQLLAGTAIALQAGVSEEALYRGVLQTELERRLGLWPALFLASAAFGYAHVGGINVDKTPWGQFLGTAMLGAGFGYLYHVSGNDLAKPVAAHVYWDAIVIATRGIEAQQQPLNNPLGFSYRF